MGNAIFIDISVFNPAQIDWGAYKQWSRQGDGISRVAIRSSYGVGHADQHFAAYRSGAIAAGVDQIFYYHYGYSQYNNPQEEADYQRLVVGALRPSDCVVLDFEEGVPAATASWAYTWLARQEANYSGKLPVIYASDAYIRARLQDTRLARFPLWLANWQYTPNERPACPPPWKSYEMIQYTDRASNIPGVAGNVDASVYIGGGQTHMPIPTNWKDDGHTLTATNGHRVVLGFRDHIINSATWDSGNEPLEEEYHTGQVLLHNTPLGAGQRQSFRDTLLWFTQEKGVVQEPYLGLEIKAAYDEIAALQAEVAKLKATAPVVVPSGLNIVDALSQLHLIQASAGSAATALQAAIKDLGGD